MPVTDDRSQTVMGRVLKLLEPFRESDGLTLTELAERTGFPRSSAHRLLLQLVGVGWLRRNGTMYHFGPKMMELGSLARSHDRIYRAAVTTMYQLHKSTGMAVHLAVLEDDDLLYLEKIGGRWAAATLNTHAGQRRPAQGTAEGVALLAYRNRRASIVRERVVGYSAGEQVRCVALAFDAGCGEIAVLSLTGLVGQTPEGAGHDLVSAVDLVVSKLSA
ncbi:IclR family transcriptional regulator [Nocardia donostiensis]|nr:helix-turn-helix domain-containing protein [Nocardia donostiensis]